MSSGITIPGWNGVSSSPKWCLLPVVYYQKTKSHLHQARDNVGNFGDLGHLTLSIYLVYVALPQGFLVLQKCLNHFLLVKEILVTSLQRTGHWQSFYVYWLEREVAISPSLNLLATAKNNLFCYVFCLELNLGTIGKKWIRAPESLVLTVPFAEKAWQRSIRNKKTMEMIQTVAW